MRKTRQSSTLANNSSTVIFTRTSKPTHPCVKHSVNIVWINTTVRPVPYYRLRITQHITLINQQTVGPLLLRDRNYLSVSRYFVLHLVFLFKTVLNFTPRKITFIFIYSRDRVTRTSNLLKEATQNQRLRGNLTIIVSCKNYLSIDCVILCLFSTNSNTVSGL